MGEEADIKCNKFWGCIVSTSARSIAVEKSIHITKASLCATDTDCALPVCPLNTYLYMKGAQGSFVQLCILNSETNWEIPLDLNIPKGDPIAFRIKYNWYKECKDTNSMTKCKVHDNYHDYCFFDVHLIGYEHSDKYKIPNKIAEQISTFLLSLIQETLEKVNKVKESMESKISDKAIETKSGAKSIDNATTVQDMKNDLDQHEKEANNLQKPPETIQEEEPKSENHKVMNEETVTNVEIQEEQESISEEQQLQGHGSQLVIEILNLGEGPIANAGNSVIVNYIGRLVNDNHSYTVIDNGFKFHLGKGEVIRGWDEGIVGMKLGGKRRITCPPSMAYGVKGAPPIIPGNSTFVFDIDLVAICCS